MPVIRGSCLCGGIKFEFSGPMSTSSNCHCSMCRKQHGAAVCGIRCNADTVSDLLRTLFRRVASVSPKKLAALPSIS